MTSCIKATKYRYPEVLKQKEKCVIKMNKDKNIKTHVCKKKADCTSVLRRYKYKIVVK